ncbi:MAG: glycosyltransferase family 4 protein, partial [Verrucomicrobiota bacterium]
DVEATGQLLSELCEDLSETHEVTVVAGRPYNMACWGSVSPILAETRGRVRILRAYNPRLNKRLFAARVLNLLSYFCFSFLAGFFARRPEVVVAETDPPVLGLIGLLFAKLHRAKFVFYVQDLFPEVGVALGQLHNPLLIKLLDAGTRQILRGADAVVVLGHDMRERVKAKACCRASRIRIISNWVDTRKLRPQPKQNPFREQHQLGGCFVVMYSGNLGLSQGLHRVIEIAAAMQDLPTVRFVFVGEGAAKERLLTRARALGLKNVLLLPYQPKESLSYSLSAADVHLVTLERGLAGLIVPSKVYGILAAGRPFIAAVEEESDIAELIRQGRCGIRVEPNSVEQLRAAILWGFNHREELQEMGQRGRGLAERLFDRRLAVDKFRSLIAELGGKAADATKERNQIPAEVERQPART